MTNPAFDAAMLLRGLRAMDAALGETYNVQSHMCTPSPVVYDATFPEKGIDFQQYKGITGVKNTWRGWMYDNNGDGKLKADVHEDVEATVVEAFGILERCDTTKEGLLTQSEWLSCQKGKSADDQLFDLEYLLALNSVTGKMLTLEENEPLNPADPNTYPELIQSRSDFATLQTTNQALTTELDRSREDVSLYQTLTFSLGGVLGVIALIFGIRAALRKGDKPTTPTQPKPAPSNPPPTKIGPEAKTEAKTSAPETKTKPEDLQKSVNTVEIQRPAQPHIATAAKMAALQSKLNAQPQNGNAPVPAVVEHPVLLKSMYTYYPDFFAETNGKTTLRSEISAELKGIMDTIVKSPEVASKGLDHVVIEMIGPKVMEWSTAVGLEGWKDAQIRAETLLAEENAKKAAPQEEARKTQAKR